MIEFCSKKRMVGAVIILISISVVVLLVENRLPLGHQVNIGSSVADNVSKLCLDDRVSVIEDCKPCPIYESKWNNECQPTGYRERVKCVSGKQEEKTFFKSCPKLGWLEERNFWIFECVSAAVGVLSYGVVFVRQRRLDRLLIEKVNRQIAAGV